MRSAWLLLVACACSDAQPAQPAPSAPAPAPRAAVKGGGCASTAPVAVCGQVRFPASATIGPILPMNAFSITALDPAPAATAPVAMSAISAGNIGVGARASLAADGTFVLELPRRASAVLACAEAFADEMIARGVPSSIDGRCRVVDVGTTPVTLTVTMNDTRPLTLDWQASSHMREIAAHSTDDRSSR